MSASLLDNIIEILEVIKAKYSFATQELLVKKDIDDLIEQIHYLKDHVIHSTKQIDKFVHEVYWMDSNKILPKENEQVLIYDPGCDCHFIGSYYALKVSYTWDIGEGEINIKDTYWQELTEPL